MQGIYCNLKPNLERINSRAAQKIVLFLGLPEIFLSRKVLGLTYKCSGIDLPVKQQFKFHNKRRQHPSIISQRSDFSTTNFSDLSIITLKDSKLTIRLYLNEERKNNVKMVKKALLLIVLLGTRMHSAHSDNAHWSCSLFTGHVWSVTSLGGATPMQAKWIKLDLGSLYDHTLYSTDRF